MTTVVTSSIQYSKKKGPGLEIYWDVSSRKTKIYLISETLIWFRELQIGDYRRIAEWPVC